MLVVFLSFLLILAIVMFSIALGVTILRAHERQKVRGFLAQLDERQPEPKASVLVRAESPAGIFGHVPLVRKMELAIAQAGMTTRLADVAIRACLLMIAGAGIGWILRAFIPAPGGSLFLGALGFTLPILRIRRKRTARIKAFEAQFPDALEFLSRSMLAGHGFGMSLSLVSEEAPEPLASIFRAASSEIQLGAPLARALGNLAAQIPLVDVRFFVSAVLMQQTSGGNLSEILNKLAVVVRERFRLAGEVQAASAHGRLTSIVLIALPILLTIALLIMDPEYLVQFAREPEGRFLLIAAVCGQLVGHTVIRRIVNIKV